MKRLYHTIIFPIILVLIVVLVFKYIPFKPIDFFIAGVIAKLLCDWFKHMQKDIK